VPIDIKLHILSTAIDKDANAASLALAMQVASISRLMKSPNVRP
jgi:hypothetical protein